MAVLFVTIFALLLNFSTSAQELQCSKGIKITVSGNTYDNWETEACAADSKCVTQEIKFNIGVDVTLIYGSCLSSTTAPLLDCAQNFGPDGTFDTADLLNLLPVMVEGVTRDVANSAAELYKKFKTFISTGQGAEDLIDRFFKLAGKIGYNLEKFESLKTPLVNVLDAIFGQNNATNEENCSWPVECALETIQDALTNLLPDTLETALKEILPTGKRMKHILDSVIELIKAIGKLDTTTDVDYSKEIYKFAGNFISGPTLFALKHTPVLSTAIEKLPRLIRMALSRKPNIALFYDVIFELLGDVNVMDRSQTVKDMKTTIKDRVPSYLKPIINPIFDIIFNSIQNREASSDVQKFSDAIMQLMKDAFAWVFGGQGHEYTLKSFIAAIKPAVHDVTTSFTGVIVQPISCESEECNTNLCNTPTSGGKILSSNVLLNVAIIWITINAL